MKKKTSPVLGVIAVVAILLAATALTGVAIVAPAGAPSLVSYQGQVTVNGSPYAGATGYFKFAIVDGSGTVHWSNSSVFAGEPIDAVQLDVNNGLFHVLLGDTSILHMDAPLTAAAFADSERYLRVWFSDDNVTFTQLSPDRRIASVPYALQADEARNAETLDGFHWTHFQQHYHNVIVVAKSGGDHTSIQAALDSVTGAGADNRYLVWVAPGVYDEQVTMKPFVDIEGAGELLTVITQPGSPEESMSGTVLGAGDAELCSLTVRNTGGDDYAIAILNMSASPRLTQMTATASGGTYNFAVASIGASPVLSHVTATASGVGDLNAGLFFGTSSASIRDSTVSASGQSATAEFGIYCGEPPGGGGALLGAPQGPVQVSGIRPTGGGTRITVDGSRVTGSSGSISSDSSTVVLVGSSMLGGGAAVGDYLVCAGVYDEAYAFHPNTCP